VQLATYAAARTHQSGCSEVRVGYLLLASGLLHTPEGSPLRGVQAGDIVADAPAIGDVWRRFVAALEAANGWMSGAEPVPARPLQDDAAWPPGVEMVLLDPRDRSVREYGQRICQYCDYAKLCGRQELE